jgi:dTDP-4-amino-4,6-dideoxygalactose transaminase
MENAVPELAIAGGRPVRPTGREWPAWPQSAGAEDALLRKVVATGRFATEGPMEEEFTQRFAAYQDCRFGFCVTSGTTALEVALRAVGVEPGDEVIVPSLTWLATAAAVLDVGATAVFVDVDPATYQLDATCFEAAVTARTRAVIPVHLYNRLADLHAIGAVAERHGVAVIEDDAHAHGGVYRGRKTGSTSALGCFSFQHSKALTCGEGGFVTTNDERLAERVYGLKNCGRTWPSGTGATGYVLGRNRRITEFQAAVLLAQFERFEEQFERRAVNGALLDRELASTPGLAPLAPVAGTDRQSYYAYVVRYDPAAFGGVPVDVFRAALTAEGVPAGPAYGAVYASELWAPTPSQAWRVASGANAERTNDEAVVINQPMLLGTDDDIADILNAVEKVRRFSHELT